MQLVLGLARHTGAVVVRDAGISSMLQGHELFVTLRSGSRLKAAVVLVPSTSCRSGLCIGTLKSATHWGLG